MVQEAYELQLILAAMIVKTTECAHARNPIFVLRWPLRSSFCPRRLLVLGAKH